MARYLNPIAANANIAINTASALTVGLIGSNTTDVELCTTVDAGVTFGTNANQNAAPAAANVTASANGGVAAGTHFLPAYVPRGFGVAAGTKISVKAVSANGALWVSEMG